MSKFKDFLFGQLMKLELGPEKRVVDFIDDLNRCVEAFELTFRNNYTHTFAVKNIECFVEDVRNELASLMKKSCSSDVRLSRFDFVFVTGGICIGKTTLIERLVSDEHIRRRGVHAVIEPTEYWYRNDAKHFDDTLITFAFSNPPPSTAIGQSSPSSSFPFSEFFITTWLLNLMVNVAKASLLGKTLLLVERDYSDEYLLQRHAVDSFVDSAYPCLESMKRNFGAYVVLRYITTRPLIEIMRENLMQRQSGERDVVDKPEYVAFIGEYEAAYREISLKLVAAASDATTRVLVREYSIHRYVSETYDEIKFFILNVLKS